MQYPTQDSTESSFPHYPASSDASSTNSLNDINFLQVDPTVSNTRTYRPTSFLMMNSPITPSFPVNAQHLPDVKSDGDLVFSTHAALLDYVTRNWRNDYVTVDLIDQTALEKFSTRPFFMVVSVDAPILIRYHRSLR